MSDFVWTESGLGQPSFRVDLDACDRFLVAPDFPLEHYFDYTPCTPVILRRDPCKGWLRVVYIHGHRLVFPLTPEQAARFYVCAGIPPPEDLRIHATVYSIFGHPCGPATASARPEGVVRPPGPDDARNEFCYRQRAEGRKLEAIRRAVNSTAGWRRLATPQGVTDAADSYARAHGLPPLRRRRRTRGDSGEFRTGPPENP
jgi:hypothetical protein